MKRSPAHPLRKWLIMPVLLLVTAVTGYLLLPGQQKDTTPVLRTATVTRGDLVATVSATGTLSPLTTVEVGSQVSGTIQSLEADFNSQVRAGDVIAIIEPSLFRAKLAEAEASLRNVEALRDKAEIAVREKRRTLDRLKGLQDRKLVSDSDIDTAQFAVESAVVELREQEAAVAKARATLDHERFNLEHTVIRAPIDGVVISRSVDIGQTVAASLQAPTLFTIAQDLKRMQIETDVDEAYIGQVREGQPVTFSVFAWPDRTFGGKLEQVRLEPKVEDDVVKYNCVIRVDNTDLALKPGMTATVSIEVDRRRDVLQVANEALRFVPDLPAEEIDRLRRGLGAGESILWTPSAGDLEPRTVSTGMIGEKETEIAGADVSEGMPVALPVRNKPHRSRPFTLF